MIFKESEVKTIKKYLNWVAKQDLEVEEKFFVQNLMFSFKEAERKAGISNNQKSNLEK